MKEAKVVKELRSKILGMEMELNILFRDLERLKIELVYNKKLQIDLNENINFLKNSAAAVSLSEFKKIKQQRNLVNQRIVFYNTKIEPLERIVNQKEENVKKEMDIFTEIYRMQFKNNVLEFPHDRRKEA